MADLPSIARSEQARDAEAKLLAYRSRCGFVTSTFALRCPQCGSDDLTEFALSGRGTIAAFSVQTVPSEEFLNEAPYAYVLVDLEEGGRRAGWIAGVSTPDALAIGDAVRFRAGYQGGTQFERVAKGDHGG